jgi:hypothetical protein
VTAQRAQLLSRTAHWHEGLALLDAVPELTGTPLLLRARLRDRAHRFDEAWTDAVAAKAQLAHARGHRYAPEAVRSLFTAMANLARQPAETFVETGPVSPPQPIFILGFPRSGTTLIEQVVASHSRIRAGGELPFVGALPGLIERARGAPIAAAMSGLSQDTNLIRQIHDFYMEQARIHGLLAPGADFFTDKMPLNDVYLPLIRLAFPRAALVSMERDPRDVLVSTLQNDMTHGFHCAYRLEDAAVHLAAVSDLTSEYNMIGLSSYIVRYERFVVDQTNETARLMEAIGLRPEPPQAEFHKSRRHAPTPSYAQVREPLHGRAVGRWRNYEGQLAAIEPILTKALARGGY